MGLNCPTRWERLAAFFIGSLLLQGAGMKCAVTLNCSHPDAESLYKEIAKSFDLKGMRPVYSLTTPTNVTIYFTLYGILGVDEKTQILTTYIWLSLMWKIEFLSWDPEQCGSEQITLPRQKLWMPDIIINECMDEDRSPRIPYVHLNSSGYVTDNRPVRSVSSCNLDIYTFPFDMQNCSLSFNSFIHVSSDIKIKMGESGEQALAHSNMVMNTVGEWELLDITASETQNITFYDSSYDTVVYHVVMRRRPTMYVANLLIPSCFLMIVDLFSFLLPPEAVDRANFKMTLILGFTVFLLIMKDLLPITANTLPLLNVFFSVCLALMVASLLQTIIITNILCRSNHSAVPHWVKILVLKYLARLVCSPQKLGDQDTDTYTPDTQVVKNPVSMSPSDPASNKTRLQLEDPVVLVLKELGQDLLSIRIEVEKLLTRRHVAEEWNRVGHILDRLLFILHVLFVSFSVIAFIVVWVQWIGR